jgi:hypothetical protein
VPDLCTLVMIGVAAFFALLLGGIALAFLGLGMLAYGAATLGAHPLRGLGLIAAGLAICWIVGKAGEKGPL